MGLEVLLQAHLDAGQGGGGARPTPVEKGGAWRDTPGVQVEGHLYGDRVWFYDTRSQVRRMGVSAHPVDDTMVISLWQGDFCTGTFRLPAHEAARLISTLAFGMTESMSPAGSGGEGPPAAPRQRWRQFLSSLFPRKSVTTESHLRLLP